MAERGKNQNVHRAQEEAAAREDRFHFARRHPNSVSGDEIERRLVIERASKAIAALESITEQAVSKDEEWPVAYVPIEEAQKVADAYEALDELWRHLPEVMAYTVGYDSKGWSRSVFHGCLSEEQADALAAGMNAGEAGERKEFDVRLSPCRIIDMRKPTFSVEDL